jgi:hypothetical protein
MNQDQRLKLAQALITEAVVCSDKNDIDEARHLTQLAIRHEFKEEMQRIIKGDVALFKMTFKKMYSQNIKEKIVARVMLDILIEDKDFQKTFRDKYAHVAHELWIFEKQQEWRGE